MVFQVVVLKLFPILSCRHTDVQLLVVMRHGGFWSSIPRTGRKKYECAKQQSFKVDVHGISIQDKFDTHLGTAPWLVNLAPILAATIPGSKSKTYVHVSFRVQTQFLGN